MFSTNNCYKPSVLNKTPTDTLLNICIDNLANKTGSCACIISECTCEPSTVHILGAKGIEINSFNGQKKEHIKNFFKECSELHSAPHVHNIKKSIFWHELSKICNTSTWHNKTIYFPVLLRGHQLLILLFYKKSNTISITDNTYESITEFTDIATTILQIENTTQKLNAIELYVKEVGHDIASSVQAIISKLRAVSNEHYKGKHALNKIKEAESEIMSTYRIADTLGITVDPDYNIKSGRYFEISKVIDNAITLCRSEADERRINIKYNPEQTFRNMEIWGDDKAIQTVFIQLLMNAIKYAIKSTDIHINISDTDDHNYIRCSVKNVGNPIQDEEKDLIWKFGYRGKKAVEMHVNGSGIGLYTVKKIITAHSGIVSLSIMGEHKNISLFNFVIPKSISLGNIKLL